MVDVEQILDIVWRVLLIVAIYAGKYVVQFIQAKTAKLEAETQNEIVNNYMDKAEDAICRAVIAVKQTYVDALKKQGAFDDAAQDAAFESAKAMALAMMTDEVKAIVSSAVADFDIWVTTTIENMVSASKDAKTVITGGVT